MLNVFVIIMKLPIKVLKGESLFKLAVDNRGNITDTLSPNTNRTSGSHNSESPVNWKNLYLDCRWKSEHPEKNDTGTESSCKHTAEPHPTSRSDPTTFTLWGYSANHHITMSPLCFQIFLMKLKRGNNRT